MVGAMDSLRFCDRRLLGIVTRPTVLAEIILTVLCKTTDFRASAGSAGKKIAEEVEI